jgi:drug/metabolite transporter (DMT)-like permease
MKKNHLIIGSSLVTLSAILWGVDGVLLTPRLYNLPTSYVVFLLHAVPFLLMSILFYKEFKNIKTFSKKDIFVFSLIGIFGGVLGTLSIIKALFLVQFEHLSVVVLLQKLQPLFAIILARLILKEKLGKNFLFWSITAIICAYLLTFGIGIPNTNTPNIILASFYSVLAAFSFGSSTVFGKFLVDKYKFKTVTFYRYGFTTLFMIIILFFTKGFIPISTVTKENWIIILLITFTTGTVAILLYYYGLKFINAKISTICELAFPVSAAFLDYFINNSILSVIQWLAALILIFCILIINKNQTSYA